MVTVKKLSYLVICLILVFQPFTISASDNNDAWKKDIQVVKEQLPKLHKNLFFKITKEKWDKSFDDLIDNVPSMKDNEIRVELMRLMASVGDGHTQSWYDGDYSVYPFEFKWFDDGIFCEAATANQKPSFSKKLHSIEGMLIDKVIEKVKPYIAHDNIYNFRQRFIYWITDADFLTAIGLVKNKQDAKFTFEDKNGKLYVVSARPYSNYYDIPWDKDSDYQDKVRTNPPIYRMHSGYVWARYFDNLKLMYVMYSICDADDMYEFVNWIKERVNYFSAKKLILDMRFNGGGNSRVLEPFIEWVSNHPINKPDRFFIIIDNATYSSAVLNAIQLRQRTLGTFVGQPTGGRPNHYGEVRSFYLERVRMVFTYSTKYFAFWNETDEAFPPDDEVKTSSEQYFSAIDPIVEKILADKVKIPERKPPEKPVLTRHQRWSRDLDQLKNKLNDESKYINLEMASIFNRIGQIIENIDNLTDIQIKLEIQKLLAESKIPELKVVLDLPSIPIRLVSLSDGIFATSAIKEYESVLGRKLVKIGKHNVGTTLMMKFRELFPTDNLGSMSVKFAEYAMCPDVLKFLGLIDDPKAIELEFEGDDGCPINVTAKSAPMEKKDTVHAKPFDKPETTPKYLSKPNNYWAEFFDQSRILYARFSKTEEDSTLFSLFAEQFELLYRSNDSKKIVLDLRGNQGGDPKLADDFIRKIVIKSNAMRLPVYVLIDNYTQGSAVYEACLLRNLCKTIIVGENSGTKPNHAGNPKIVEMDNESIKLAIPTESYNFETNPNTWTLCPDRPIVISSIQYFSGFDPVLGLVEKLK